MPTAITTIHVQKIKFLHKIGVSYRQIAKRLNLDYTTVRRHGSEISARAIIKKERRKYERLRLDLEWVEKRREQSRNYQRAKKRREAG